MAKQTNNPDTKPGIITRIKGFIQEVKAEMSKVTWPPVEELKASTQIVLMLLVIFASVIFVYDYVFQIIVVQLLSLG